MFQSTPPHGGRQSPLARLPQPAHGRFNPRPRMGGDRMPSVCGSCINGFNPRPRMGGDASWIASTPRSRSFNPAHFDQVRLVESSAPAWGATSADTAVRPKQSRFNPRSPAWGATRAGKEMGSVLECFNPRPRMGGDLCDQRVEHPHERFNPRPRMGGDHQLSHSWRSTPGNTVV